MNTEETNLQAPVIDLPSFNDPAPKKEEPTPETSATDFSSNFGSAPSFPLASEDTFDPVNLIETLDPTYEEQKEIKLGIDLKSAINTIRDTKDILSSKGFNISLEETDINDE